jgi:hypothetical protein
VLASALKVPGNICFVRHNILEPVVGVKMGRRLGELNISTSMNPTHMEKRASSSHSPTETYS